MCNAAFNNKTSVSRKRSNLAPLTTKNTLQQTSQLRNHERSMPSPKTTITNTMFYKTLMVKWLVHTTGSIHSNQNLCKHSLFDKDVVNNKT